MFKTFFIKELSSGLKRPMVYIFLFVFMAITITGVVNDKIDTGGAMGSVFRNAPHVISTYTAYLSIFGLLLAAAYFNNAALRDYHSNFNEIIFSTPLQKSGYFFGRFLGALFLSTIPLIGVYLGFLLASQMGPDMGWISADRFKDFDSASFINNYLLFILPNMFFAGSIIYAFANKWKNTMISFIAALAIVTAYFLSGTLLKDLDNEIFAAFTDMFGIRAYQLDTKYFTSVEKNNTIIGFNGLLIANRLLWFLVGTVVLFASYYSFNFLNSEKQQKKGNKESQKSKVIELLAHPIVNINFNIKTTKNQFISFYLANFFSILRSTTFKIIFFLSGIILILSIVNGFDYYGLKSYPVTYKMNEFIRGISSMLVMIILVFFSGELVWRDRDEKISEVIDATPHNSLISLYAKAFSLISLTSLISLFLIAIAIVYQLMTGYTKLELDLYFLDFIYAALPTYIIWSCILIFVQVSINNKYIGYFVSVLLLFLFDIFVEAFDIVSYMYNLGTVPFYTYSDMNGFGAALQAVNWYHLYWLFFGFLLMAVAGLIWVRGKSFGLINRMKSAVKHLTLPYLYTSVSLLILFVLTTGFVYYNTEVLNTYQSRDVVKELQVSYENKYSKFKGIAQPKITKVKYEVDIFPEDRKFLAKSYLTLKNESDKPIDSLHFSLFGYLDEGPWGLELKLSPWNIVLDIPNSELVVDDKDLRYRIYQLKKPLVPNEELKIEVLASYQANGFENEVTNVRVAKNGTFVENYAIIPVIGYYGNYEIMDSNDRMKFGLKEKKFMASLHEGCTDKCMVNYITEGMSDWVDIETTISTSLDQIAIAPGSLTREWKENNRNFFRYKLDKPSQNFFTFISARYEVVRRKWNGIDIEIYHHKDHNYNTNKMVNAVEKSLKYYTDNFGPYYHKQARIIEFPRYFTFAQAFPGTMPYSEAYGFITNLENERDNNVIDAVVAHEMAHQWWGHQVVGATVQGATMLSESFAEYSSLMVMKHSLKDDQKMKKFLKYDLDLYLKGRGREPKKEMPLYKIENQNYIHYGKGSMIMYALQEYIGEEKVNNALRNFLNDFKYKAPPYPTTLDFLSYLEPEVPDSLNYLIIDWFKEITLYDYRLKNATYTKLANGKYQVNMDISSQKYKVDAEGKEIKSDQNDWVEIGVFSDGEEKELVFSEKVLLTDSMSNFSFEVEKKPFKAVLDPRMLLIEKVQSDNVMVLEEIK